MKLVDMMATYLKREEQNEVLREIAYTKLPFQFQVALVNHGMDPSSFAGGINFLFQLLQVHGLPDDWDELTKSTPSDPAKESEVPLTRVDGQMLGNEVEEFMAAWMKFKGEQGPSTPSGPASAELC